MKSSGPDWPIGGKKKKPASPICTHDASPPGRWHPSPPSEPDPTVGSAPSWRKIMEDLEGSAGVPASAMQGPGPPLFNHLHERMLRALQNSFRPTGMEWNTGSGCTLHCTAKNTMQARDSLWVSTAVLHGIGMHGVDQRIHGHFISSRSR